MRPFSDTIFKFQPRCCLFSEAFLELSCMWSRWPSSVLANYDQGRNLWLASSLRIGALSSCLYILAPNTVPGTYKVLAM